jgi:glycosyltransferase involved in cell wall biosynthesis
MKISVVVIAHNEEKYIAKCLKSLMNQTVKANEIILVAHNCTDKTVEIASRFHVSLKILKGEKGIAHARYHGISFASGDKVLCTDGDTVVPKNWIQSLSQLLDESKSMMAGTRVKYKGNLFWVVVNNIIFIHSIFRKNKAALVWGPSFGFTKQMKELVLKCLKEFPILHKKLYLKHYPDDYWMTLNADLVNPIIYSRKAPVESVSKQNFLDSIIRATKDRKNTVILDKYFKKGRLLIKK